MKKRVANIIIEHLVQENIKYIFGITGKAISPFIDAILDYDDIEFISAKHESGAALMAFGYAQGSGNIGVCCGTTGGGSTNLATGVATAYMNSVPLLVFTGQVSTGEFGKGAFQESVGYGQSINIVDFFKPISKESFVLINQTKVAETIRYAIRSATSGRKGPVHINIPIDIQMAEVECQIQENKKHFPSPVYVFKGQVPTPNVRFEKGVFQEPVGNNHLINSFKTITNKPIIKEKFALTNHIKVGEKIRYANRNLPGRMSAVSAMHKNSQMDIQLAEIENQLQEEKKKISSNVLHWDCAGIEESINLINEAKKPVFFVGWGGVLSGANNEIIEIAEKLNIPIATTIQGKGAVPTNHSLCLGVMGICGHSSASKYIFDESDLLIAVGTTFNEFTSLNWDERFLKNKSIIQIDIDNREIGKNYPVQVGLVGDAKAIIHQLKQAIYKSNIKSKKSGDEIENFNKINEKYFNSHLMEDNSIPIKPQRLMKEVRSNTPDNSIFLADSGSHWAWAMHYIPIYKGGGFYPTIGLGSMGASICSSIGIKLSKPDNPVICICGDGSFLMNGNEVATAEQFNIPVIWVILNDSRYSMPAVSSKMIYKRTIGVDLSKTNFSKLAEAYNVKGYRVEDPSELPNIIHEAVTLNKPVVIDVVIDPDEVAPAGNRLKYNK